MPTAHGAAALLHGEQGGNHSHTIPNYGVVVEKGLAALMTEAQQGLAKSHDPEQQSFFQGVELALGGIIDYAEHLSEKALELAEKETDPQRRQELQQMSEICQWVQPCRPGASGRP